MRLDQYLVNNNYFSTRNKAQQAIKSSRVKVNNKIINKTGYEILDNDIVDIKKIEYDFVSRGGYKLLKAINDFELDFKDKVILDLGASTGGFTDCSLKFGAKKVYAVDVGTNQLASSLVFDPRVISIENLNVKDLDPNNFNDIDYIVMDVSFISIKKLINKLSQLIKENIALIALIKPQFEVENKNINKNGLVKNKEVHVNVISQIIDEFKINNIYLNNLTFSPLKGEKSGNIEYLALFSLKEEKYIDINKIVNNAYKNLL